MCMPMECTDTVTVSEWVTWKNWESPLSFKLHPASTRGQTHTTGLQSNMLLLLMLIVINQHCYNFTSTNRQKDM